MSDPNDTLAERLARLEKQVADNERRLDALEAAVQRLQQQVAAKAKRYPPEEKT
jgi:uncharacterized coiled-coil protein SlyX